MKKLMMCCVAMTAISLLGETIYKATTNGFTWAYYLTGESVCLCGSLNSHVTCITPKPSGSLAIPSTLDGRIVTGIAAMAFENCTELTSVTIPDSVTKITGDAFNGCAALTNVVFGNDAITIDDDAFLNCDKLWAKWFRKLEAGSLAGSSPSVVTTIVQQVAAPYVLTNSVADRAIASVTVSADCSIDSFVLKDGKVYDCVLYVNNTADNDVTLTLPSGNVYKAFKGAKPLTIPAKSQHIITITRVADTTFLVSREELDTLQ